MWSRVAQRLTQITPPAAIPDQFWQRVEAVWFAVPQEHIQSLSESMPRRVATADWNPGKHSVADAVGVARSVVARLWNRFQETGNVRRRPGVGRPRATTSTDDRYIQLTAHRNRTENATQLQRQLLLATG
ncbi:transposable element Tcb1 transposase [Trichonephila clavipes]|uniref:Transposable element Tcb1 transposase n=1 Tax=Trichonephila clavipes TaxID=2585209 RepID=A0A8X6RAL4_TRICX|nr:transposable element Tcb1 transposase [Trichonephila clavipes]